MSNLTAEIIAEFDECRKSGNSHPVEIIRINRAIEIVEQFRDRIAELEADRKRLEFMAEVYCVLVSRLDGWCLEFEDRRGRWIDTTRRDTFRGAIDEAMKAEGEA